MEKIDAKNGQRKRQNSRTAENERIREVKSADVLIIRGERFKKVKFSLSSAVEKQLKICEVKN